MSDAEESLFAQIRWLKLPRPNREQTFHQSRKWRFDFAWPDRLLAVEVEGGSFIHGHHSYGAGFEADCIKYSEAAILGWRILRVTTAMVDDGRAVALIERALKEAP